MTRNAKTRAAIAAAAGAVLSLAPAAAAQGAYDGHSIVRVFAEGARQTLAVQQLGLVLMEEAPGRFRGTDYLASPAALAAMEAAGVRFEVVVPDAQAVVDAERARLDARERYTGAAPGGPLALAGSDVEFFSEFRDITELAAFIADLEASYPGLISSEVIGQSVEGRDIVGYTISGPDGPGGKPALVFNGTAHAREWMSPMTVLYIMEQLLAGYGTDDRTTALLDSLAFHVAPVMNPDGYIYSWSSERFWRKNRRDNGDGTFGVDWNRNFSVGFGVGSDGFTSSDIYRGPFAFSEPESRALRDWVNALPAAKAHIDFHAFSQLVLWPWGDKFEPLPEPDLTTHVTTGIAMADAIGDATGATYAPIQAVDLYPAGGTSQDWTYGEGGLVSYTIELRPASSGQGGFAPPPALIQPTVEENFAAITVLAEAVLNGVIAGFPQGLPQRADPSTETAIEVTLAPAFSGPLDEASAVLLAREVAPGLPAGPFDESPLTPLGASRYTGTLPAASCGSTIEYAFRVTSLDGVDYTVPAAGSVYTTEVAEATLAFLDDLEAGNLGWTVGAAGDTATTGLWELADPQGTAAQPENDDTPGGTLCWVTGASAGGGLGSFDVDNGATTLVSPPLDAAGIEGEVYLEFSLWYSNDQGSSPNSDSMPIDISADGGVTWVPLDLISDNAGAWVTKRYRVADAVQPTSDLRVRFVARDDAPGSIVEAAVDNLRLVGEGCPSLSPADINGDGQISFADVTAFIDAFNAAAPGADANGDGLVNFADVTAFIEAFNDGAP